jgi:hypothetical protein
MSAPRCTSCKTRPTSATHECEPTLCMHCCPVCTPSLFPDLPFFDPPATGLSTEGAAQLERIVTRLFADSDDLSMGEVADKLRPWAKRRELRTAVEALRARGELIASDGYRQGTKVTVYRATPGKRAAA